MVAGEHDASVSSGHEVEVGVNRIFVGNYDDLAKTSDVALLLLDEPLPDEDAVMEDGSSAAGWINEICLPESDDVVEKGQKCHLMGWGYLSNGIFCYRVSGYCVWFPLITCRATKTIKRGTKNSNNKNNNNNNK